ncbi:MAG: hypothetical protein B6I28_05965 [Fusobacteriia bacterium 4572_132]|nr:MAG: hypothetical protein B6I28_05965 [Fusobacteriia bacterium 4572_132]
MENKIEGQNVIFSVAEEQFSLPLNTVKEIIRIPTITQLPLAPKYVEGIINLRGEVVSVISLRDKFGIEKLEKNDQERIVIVIKGNALYGLRVDKMHGVINIEKEDISKAGSNESEFVNEVIKYKSEIYMNLDLNKVLDIKINQISDKKLEQKGKKEKVKVNIEEEEKFVTFQLDKEKYAIKINCVKEIIRFKEPKKMPTDSEYFMGVIKLRDEILPIADFRIQLGVDSRKIDEFTKVVVIESNGISVGYIVDRIDEVLSFPKSKILIPPAYIKAQGSEEISAIIKAGENKILMVLDPNKILTKADEKVAEKEQNRNIKEKLDENKLKMLETSQFIVFELEKTFYGVEIEKIQEINRLENVMKIPKSADFVEGIINLRGEVIPVVNLRKKFKIEEIEKTDFTRIIIGEINKKKIGFVVDNVREVLRVEKRKLSDISNFEVEKTELINSVYKKGEKMILMLNFDKLLDVSEMAGIEEVKKNISEEK